MIVKIIIDSQNRDTDIYDNPFDFSIKLENVFRNVQAIELQDVVVPYMETNQTFVYARIHEIDCRQFILAGNSDKQVRNIEYSLARFQIPGRNSRNLITLNKSSSYVAKCSIPVLNRITMSLYDESGDILKSQVNDLQGGEPDWNTFEIDGTDDDQNIIEDMGNGRIYLRHVKYKTGTSDIIANISKNQYLLAKVSGNTYYILIESIKETSSGVYDILLAGIAKDSLDQLNRSNVTFDLSIKGKPLKTTECSFVIAVHCEDYS